MKPIARNLITAACLALALGSAMAQSVTAKDVVLDRIARPVTSPTPVPAAANSDAMAVSVLLESPDGTLTPKSTNALFRTGDRFRVKVMSSRDAKVSIYNTTPRGETSSTPVWQGEVRMGQDTVTPRLVLTGNSGIDQLHVVLEPQQTTGVVGWLTNWLRGLKEGGTTSKDVQLDVQNTETATYMVNSSSQGLVSTVSIVHTVR